MRKNKLSGFTLIELLVVITIIGILAVGGVSVYTQQMAKARDTTRIKDVKALEGAVQGIYSDTNTYPTMTQTLLANYLTTVPKDSKTNQVGCFGTLCDYTYKNGSLNGITAQGYEISTGLENQSDTKLKQDADNTTAGINANARLQVGNDFTITSNCVVTGIVAYANCTTSSAQVIK